MSSSPPLAHELAKRIRAGGPISVATFMTEALSHPQFGYYLTRDPLGTDGDFITAPEISQIFGELIGLWCADIWLRSGSPTPVRLIELGPGRGTLMADALRAARSVPQFLAAIDLHLVETSPVLRARQQATLAGVEATWHETVQTLPAGPGLFIANEFFDALPIRQFQMTGQGWAERLVGLAPEEGTTSGPCFRFILGPARKTADMPDQAPNGAIFETAPISQAIVEAISTRLDREGGALLAIDYGYVGPAFGDTLQAVRHHAYTPVLDQPGEADLTAHVNFTALGDAARRSGCRVWGPVDQGIFLRALGADIRAETLKARADPPHAAAIDASFHRLTAPKGMGTLFKVLAIGGRGVMSPAGFDMPTT